jgi:Uma2 family endonuclease
MAVTATHYKFNVDDYHRMVETGILNEGARVELIEGEIVTMAAQGGRHIRCVTIMTRLLFAAVDDALYVAPQCSIRLDRYSEPEPDFSILRALPEGDSPPTIEDVVLLVEVAKTSLPADLNLKAPLYARAGVPELWIVDLDGARVIRYLEPVDGHYSQTEEYQPGDQIASASQPPIVVEVAAIFA